MIEGLTFDEPSHTYRFEGELVPSVTTILKPLVDFSHVNAGVLSAASSFGTAVHLACELDDLGQLDEKNLDEHLLPYLSAWRRFSTDHSVEWDLVEARVFHKSMRYAGTLDRYGKVAGKHAVVDIKTSSSLYPSVGPQLAAYKNAIPSAPPVCSRIAVQLKGDGNYIVKHYTDKSDWPLFASLVTLKSWCATHNITPKF
jgi:hypothetical protein